MGIFKKPELSPISFEDEKQYVVDWLRRLDQKTYDKVLKTVEIYRKADEKVKAITQDLEDGEKMSEEEFEEKISELME